MSRTAIHLYCSCDDNRRYWVDIDFICRHGLGDTPYARLTKQLYGCEPFRHRWGLKLPMTKKEQDTNPEDDSVENVHEEPIQRENEEVVRGEKDRWRSIIAFTVNFVVYEDIFHDNFPHFDTTFSIQEHRVHFKAGDRI
ncbi:hypothetical protein AAVH_23774 [Aphelenchoides avenae]|nr:hypothetical protein AAVH_23774 [Aphelenchus avenae]